MRRMGQSEPNATDSARVDREDANRDVMPPALWRLFALVWLLFLYYPLHDLFHARSSPFQLTVTVAGTALLVTLYLCLALPLPFGTEAVSRGILRTHLMPLTLAALLTADIILLTFLASVEWLWFVMFVSIALGVRLPARTAAASIAAISTLTVIVGVDAFGWVYALRIALPVTVVGLGMIGVGWLVSTIRALRIARNEIARLAIAEERLRFARDLHDLLGHSLSAITLKNEVARSLVPTHPDRAVQELADAIGLAREALREVRQAVSGYRQPTLAIEIRNARVLLDAAGIVCTVEDSTGTTPLPPALEAVLAWTVREGATNVVRYSGAQHCAIAVQRQADSIAVEVTDDGHGSGVAPSDSRMKILISDNPGHAGAGLHGLAERAAQLHGQMEAGPREPIGFYLRVTVPIPTPTLHTEPMDDGTAHLAQERVTEL